MAELIPVPGTSDELVLEEDGNFFPVLVDEQGSYYVTIGEENFLLDPEEVTTTLNAMEWNTELESNVQLLEHRLARPLTSTEHEEIVADASRSGHTDTFDSFLAHHPEVSRTQTEQDRVQFAAEVVQENFDAAEEEDAEEQEYDAAFPDPLADSSSGSINERLTAAPAESFEESGLYDDDA